MKKASFKWLKLVIIATFISSILHYVDNILYFQDYPEPVWINPGMIDVFWIFMSPLALIGYRWIKAEKWKKGAFALVLYGLCNLLSLGHYNYASIADISVKIHIFILIESFLALILLGLVIILFFRNISFASKAH